MKSGNGKKAPLAESDVVRRMQLFRARLIQELSFAHHNMDVKEGMRNALKWLDKYLLGGNGKDS